MKGNKFNSALMGLAKSLQTVAQELPKQIEEAKKNLSKEDAEKIRKALKDSDFDKKISDLNIAKSDLQNLLKNF